MPSRARAALLQLQAPVRAFAEADHVGRLVGNIDRGGLIGLLGRLELR